MVGVLGFLEVVEVYAFDPPSFSTCLEGIVWEVLSSNGWEEPSDFADFFDFTTGTYWEEPKVGGTIWIGLWVGVVLG